MTREEIETIPKNVNTLLDLSVTMNTRQKLDEKLTKVCELAIKALEQEPCEEYKRGWHDAIVTALKETHNYYTEDGVFKAIQEESLIGVGMSMQEPKTGHWDYTDAYPHWVCCDKCKTRYIPNKEWIKAYNMPTNYCPNCGAKMESEVVEDA